MNIWFCRLALFALNIPAVVLAVKNIDILEVFLVADLCAAAVLPPVLLGLIPAMSFLNGFDVVVGACGGYLTTFIFGIIYYHGDAVQAGNLLGLTSGLYIGGDDYSVLGAFFAAPLGSVGWTLGGSAVRIGATYAWCRARGEPFELRRHHFDRSAYVLPEDRVNAFDGMHGSGNPEDGHKEELMTEGEQNSDNVHAASGQQGFASRLQAVRAKAMQALPGRRA